MKSVDFAFGGYGCLVKHCEFEAANLRKNKRQQVKFSFNKFAKTEFDSPKV